MPRKGTKLITIIASNNNEVIEILINAFVLPIDFKAGNTMYIGGCYDNNQVNSLIDEFYIYDKALTLGQIKTIYNQY